MGPCLRRDDGVATRSHTHEECEHSVALARGARTEVPLTPPRKG